VISLKVLFDTRVAFKDLFIRELESKVSPTKGFVPLFNGKNLSGWKSVGEPRWSWADGRLLGSPAPSGGPGFLVTDAKYEDFELELQYRLAPGAGSGLFLRADADGLASGKGQLEVQIVDDDWYKMGPLIATGSIYNVFPRRLAPLIKRGDWNNLRVRLKQRHIEVWLNAIQTIDADLDTAGNKLATVPGLRRKSGGIGLQQNQKADVEFRDLRIKNLAPPAEQGFVPLFNGKDLNRKDLTGWGGSAPLSSGNATHYRSPRFPAAVANSAARNLPVYDVLHAAISSGVPQAINWPPLWPPSGPRSMT
jgi:hypothetical protein